MPLPLDKEMLLGGIDQVPEYMLRHFNVLYQCVKTCETLAYDKKHLSWTQDMTLRRVLLRIISNLDIPGEKLPRIRSAAMLSANVARRLCYGSQPMVDTKVCAKCTSPVGKEHFHDACFGDTRSRYTVLPLPDALHGLSLYFRCLPLVWGEGGWRGRFFECAARSKACDYEVHEILYRHDVYQPTIAYGSSGDIAYVYPDGTLIASATPPIPPLVV